MIDLADVLDVICVDGNFENRSTHTNMYFFVSHVNGSGPAKSNSMELEFAGPLPLTWETKKIHIGMR